MACASAHAAEPVALSGENLKQMVPGSAIAIDTPLNSVVPIRFTADGLMTGEAGSLASYLGAERDRGRWWIAGDQLCLKWFRWFDAEQRCLQLRMDGDRIHWQEQDGKTGTATITERAPEIPAKRPVVVAAVVTPPPAPAPVLAAQPLAKTDEAPAAAAPNLANLSIISRAEAATPPAATAEQPAATETDTPASAEAPPKAEPASPAKTGKHAKSTGKVKAQVPSAKAKPVKAAKTPAAPPSKTAAKTALEPTYKVAGVDEDDVLNIRNGPSEYHDAVGAIPPSARGVKIVGACSDLWCPVVHGKAKGWVNSYYLSPEAGSTARTTAEHTPR